MLFRSASWLTTAKRGGNFHHFHILFAILTFFLLEKISQRAQCGLLLADFFFFCATPRTLLMAFANFREKIGQKKKKKNGDDFVRGKKNCKIPCWLSSVIAHLWSLDRVVLCGILVEHDRRVRVGPQTDVGHHRHHRFRRQMRLARVWVHQLLFNFEEEERDLSAKTDN